MNIAYLLTALLSVILVFLAFFIVPEMNREASRVRMQCYEKGGIYITDVDRLFGTCYDKKAIIELK